MIRILRPASALILLSLISFSIAPAQQKGKGKKPQPAKESAPAVATVNGENIPYARYLELYRDQSNHQRIAGQDTTVDIANADAIFLQLVDEALLHQEAVKRKINVTRDQAFKLLLSNPPEFVKIPFTQNGVFYEETFRNVAQDPTLIAQLVGAKTNREEVIEKWKKDLEKVVRYIQNQEIRRRLGDQLYAEKPFTPAQIRNRYFAEKTTFTGSFVRVLHSTVPDSLVPVTEPELRTWYDTHKEEYRFSSARYISSLILPVIALSSDSSAQMTRVEQARLKILGAPVAERRNIVAQLAQGLPENRFAQDEPISLGAIPEFARTEMAAAKQGDVLGPYNIEGEQVLMFVESTIPTPDTVARARHILIKPGDATQDSLVNVMFIQLKDSIKNEDDFIRYAKLLGQDGSAPRGGDLGYFGRGTMISVFDSIAFNSPTGRAIGPITTRFGQHLVWVNERITNGYRLRELRFPLNKSEQATDLVMRDARLYADALRADSPSIDSLIREIKKRTPEALSDTSLLRQLEIYGDALTVTNFAFSANPGDVAIIRLPFDRVAVVKLLQAWPAGIAEYVNLRDGYVTPQVMRAKQLDYLKSRMMVLRDSMTPEMTLGFIRNHAPLAESFMVQSQVASSPPDEDPTILDSLIAVTPAGAVTGPVRGTHAYYFLRVEEHTLRPREEDFLRDREAFTKEYLQRTHDKLISDLLKKRREYADVEDKRPISDLVLRP